MAHVETGGSSERARAGDALRDDPHLRERFRAGEREAMQAVYTAYADTVRARVGAAARRGWVRPSELDDVVQSVFLAAFEERSRLAWDGLRSYGGFLNGIVTNVLREQGARRARFERPASGAAGVGDGADGRDVSAPVAEERLVALEVRDIAAAFRAGVTDPMERGVLERLFVAGDSEERAAKALGISRWKLRRTAAKLTKRMKAHLKRAGLEWP